MKGSYLVSVPLLFLSTKLHRLPSLESFPQGAELAFPEKFYVCSREKSPVTKAHPEAKVNSSGICAGKLGEMGLSVSHQKPKLTASARFPESIFVLLTSNALYFFHCFFKLSIFP